MKLDSICLTADSLRRLATNELSPEQLRQLERHIDRCPHCLELMQQEVTAPWLEDSVKDLLKSEDSRILPTAIDDESSPTPSYASILKMLGPTDDPHRMGRIDTYEVVGIIGRGGMGVVFKAFDPALQRFVAIKMLLPHLAESAAARKRFAREAKAAAAVVDDFVLPIHGVSEWQGVPYIVSQYCRGETLQRRIENLGPLGTTEILRIASQIAKGLAAAHAQGLVHRDVKPANILLDKGIERVQLTDFGLARAVDDASMTRTGVLAGTPQFMSPEQAKGDVLDGRSDLFALGSVMYTMCTGRPPFRASQTLAILQKISNEKHKSVQLLNPEVPRRLARMIDRLLEKRPADRIQSAEEVAEWLEAYLAYLQHPGGQSKPRLPVSNRKRKRLMALAITGLATIAAVLGTGYFSDLNPTRNALQQFFSSSDDGSVSFEESNGTGIKGSGAASLAEVDAFETRIQAFALEQQAWAVTQSESNKLVQAIEAYRHHGPFDFGPPETDSMAAEIQRLQSQMNAFERQKNHW